MYDIWQKGVPGPYGGSWSGSPKDNPVWRHEFHFTRSFLHNLTQPIESAYDLLDQFRSLWAYATGTVDGDADGAPDGWLRYVLPTEDSNQSRWPTHPAWVVAQSAFAEPLECELGAIVRKRIRQVNLDRGLAGIIGYTSTMSAWLGGDFAAPDADMSLTFQWLYEHGQEYLQDKERVYIEEVARKQKIYHSEGIE